MLSNGLQNKHIKRHTSYYYHRKFIKLYNILNFFLMYIFSPHPLVSERGGEDLRPWQPYEREGVCQGGQLYP